MATRNFVPRSGSEGQVGTSEKPWAVVVADIMHVGAISGSISSSVEQTGSFGHVYSAGNIYAAGEVSADSFVSRDGNDTISFQDDVAFGADDSITSILNITASNNISASGNIYGTNLLADSASFSTRVTNLKSDSGSFSTRITNFSTGNVESVSGSSSSTGSFGRIFAAGDIYATGEVSADSFVSRDGSNTISFQDDVAFGADDSITSIQNITATGNISGSVTSTGSFHHIKSNRIQSTDNGGLRLFEDGGSGIFVEDGGRVGIGDLSPESTLKVTGDLTVSTNITASNDLAVSGIAGIGGAPISGNALTVNGTNNVLRLRHTGAPATSNRVNIDFSTNNAGTRNMYIETMNNSANGNSMMTIGGYFFTAVGGYADVLQIGAPDSGNTKALVISGSAASTGSFGRVETAGDINSDGRIYEQDTSVIDHATAMAIVFGG